MINRRQVLLGTTALVAAAALPVPSIEQSMTIDGVELVAGDRFILWHQTNPTENGIYKVAT